MQLFLNAPLSYTRYLDATISSVVSEIACIINNMAEQLLQSRNRAQRSTTMPTSCMIWSLQCQDNRRAKIVNSQRLGLASASYAPQRSSTSSGPELSAASCRASRSTQRDIPLDSKEHYTFQEIQIINREVRFNSSPS